MYNNTSIHSKQLLCYVCLACILLLHVCIPFSHISPACGLKPVQNKSCVPIRDESLSNYCHCDM